MLNNLSVAIPRLPVKAGYTVEPDSLVANVMYRSRVGDNPAKACMHELRHSHFEVGVSRPSVCLPSACRRVFIVRKDDLNGTN